MSESTLQHVERQPEEIRVDRRIADIFTVYEKVKYGGSAAK
jgi:hypothetical protein